MTNTVESFAEHVGSRLAGHAPDGIHRYLVVDQAALHGVDIQHGLGWNGPSWDLLEGVPPNWATTASPVLVAAAASPLSESQRRVWQKFAANWRYANALTYVESPVAFAALALALTERTKGLLPDNMRVLLRWYDNRVLSSLLQVLDVGQLQALLAPLTHCAIADRRGLVRLTSCAPAPSLVPQFPLELSVTQEALLLEASEADALIDILLGQGQSALLELLPPDQYDCVLSLWQTARRYGIFQVSDQIAFCHLGLEVGQGFDLHEPWSGVIQQASSEKGSFVKALARLEGAAP